MKIALFTPFSPEIGGGSAQLRSHLRHLPELDVQWHYLAEQPASQAQSHWKWLGERLTPAQLLSDLSARTGFLPGSKARVRHLLQRMDADLYWVVGHYEGISVAAELCEQGKPVHLTVHDDPFGTWTRADRYRMFQPLLRCTFPKLLRQAQSIDVTSWGMRNLYRRQYGVNCFSVYLHVSGMPLANAAPDPHKLTIGHIGTLYYPQPFRRFVSACKRIAAEQKRVLRIVRIGSSPQMDSVAKEDPALFESHGDLSEEAAVPLLAACDLLYAMYPCGSRYELFRRTSLPIKVSTYVQAQRPIFAHTPPDSTLARIVGSYAVGTVCASEGENEIGKQIEQSLYSPVRPDKFERLRRELMGVEQIQQLGAALRREDWRRFPEFDFRQ